MAKTENIKTKAQRPLKLREFHTFPNLPIEIRDMIWTEAAAGVEANVVAIQMSNVQEKTQIGYAMPQAKLRACYSIPALLHACSESRKNVKGTIYVPILEAHFKTNPVYLNQNLDVLFFKNLGALNMICGVECETPVSHLHRPTNLRVPAKYNQVFKKVRRVMLGSDHFWCDYPSIAPINQKLWAAIGSPELLVINRDIRGAHHQWCRSAAISRVSWQLEMEWADDINSITKPELCMLDLQQLGRKLRKIDNPKRVKVPKVFATGSRQSSRLQSRRQSGHPLNHTI